MSFDAEHPAVAAFTEIAALLFPGEGLVRAAHEDGLRVVLEDDASLGGEAYRIVFATHDARVTAGTAVGFLYGIIT